MRNQKKTAPDAGTSKGGKGDISTLNIPSESEIVKRLSALKHTQSRGGICPRCGSSGVTTHVTSRWADVYICQACLDDEQHEVDTGCPHMLLADWDYVRTVMLS